MAVAVAWVAVAAAPVTVAWMAVAAVAAVVPGTGRELPGNGMAFNTTPFIDQLLLDGGTWGLLEGSTPPRSLD